MLYKKTLTNNVVIAAIWMTGFYFLFLWGTCVGGMKVCVRAGSHILIRRLGGMIYELGRLHKAAKTKQPGGDELAQGERGEGERPSPSDIIQTNHGPERTISSRQSMNISPTHTSSNYPSLHSVWLKPAL